MKITIVTEHIRCDFHEIFFDAYFQEPELNSRDWFTFEHNDDLHMCSACLVNYKDLKHKLGQHVVVSGKRILARYDKLSHAERYVLGKLLLSKRLDYPKIREDLNTLYDIDVGATKLINTMIDFAKSLGAMI